MMLYVACLIEVLCDWSRDNNYIGLSFQPPVKEASKNKNKTSSNNLLADGDKTKSNNKNQKKVVENVNEVKDLAPLLYTCLSLHIGKPEAQKAMNYFSGIEAQYLNSLSLDDIEEIASIKQEGESWEWTIWYVRIYIIYIYIYII